MRRFRQAAALLAVTFLASGSSEPNLAVAYPRLLVFYGGELSDPRYITNQGHVVRFMQELGPDTAMVPPAASRPHVRVAMYWHNPTWAPYATDTALLRSLPLPSDPRLRTRAEGLERGGGWVDDGRLYLATQTEPLVFECVDCTMGRARYSVPTRKLRALLEGIVPVEKP